MVPVCDKRYHIYNRFRHFWAEIKKLWNYPLARKALNLLPKIDTKRYSVRSNQITALISKLFSLVSLLIRK